MSDYVPLALRRLVTTRADGRCEYCRYPQAVAFLTFEVEHIIARKHGGQSTDGNLVLACPFCNQAKGTDLASLDPETGALTALFNPRTDRWNEHFALAGTHLLGLTAIGRVTATLLQFNNPGRLTERELLIHAGMYDHADG